MGAIVSFFQSVIAIINSIIPLTEVGANKESLLAHLGQTTGGLGWHGLFHRRCLVLCGAVLTSFVGFPDLNR